MHTQAAQQEQLGNWSDSPCFYVSILDANRTGLVAGPFRTHAAALAVLPIARELGYTADPWSHFYHWGTCKMATGRAEGTLNPKLRAVDTSIDRGEWPHTAEHIAEAAHQALQTAPAEVSRKPVPAACCIRNGCGRRFDPSAPESRETLIRRDGRTFSALRPFWRRYCPEHRAAAEPLEVVTEVRP